MITENYLYYVIVASIIVLIILLILIYKFLKARKIEKKFIDACSDNQNNDVSKEDSSFKKSFIESQEFIKTKIADKRYKYSIPWVLLLGNRETGKSSVLSSLNIPSPFSYFNEQEKVGYDDCGWKFYDKALMIDVAGSAIFKNDNEKQWDNFLKQLYTHKSKRPLDSIVLTVPVSDLIYTGNFTDEHKVEVIKKAQAAFNKIAYAQAKLGMSVPVYLLITKTDLLPGFNSFVSGLPEEMTRDILGWSNPNSPDKIYTQTWIDEAFEQISGNIHKLQLEIFTDKANIQDRDSLFLFTGKLNSLALPLKCYLNEVFKQNVYYEPFVLRGIYFTGYSPDKKNVFIQRLFEEKIFPEYGLAKPLHKSAYELKKPMSPINYAYIAGCAVWLIGLIIAYPMLNSRKKEVLPLFQKSADLINLQKTIKNFDEEQISLFLKSALSIAGEMDKVSELSLNSFFIPASWFSSINSEKNSVLQQIYKKVIITTLYENLTGRTLSQEEREAIPPELQSLIIELLKQDFMKITAPRNYPDKLQPDKMIIWDQKILVKATEATQKYNSYFTKELDKFPSDVRNNVKMSVDRQMTGYLRDLIVSAISLENTATPGKKSDAELAKELKSLNESNKLMVSLIKILRNSSLQSAGSELNSLLFLYYYSLLESIDGKSRAKGLYQFENSLNNWNGTDNLRTLLFRTEEFGKIADDLKKMRDDITVLALNQAKPLIGFINDRELFPDNSNLFLVEKWQRIARDIESYPENLPANPLVHLENFLLKDLSMINVTNYKNIISLKQYGNSENSFFTQKEKEIAFKVYSEAGRAAKGGEIAAGGAGGGGGGAAAAKGDAGSQKALEAYKEIRDYFNTSISGKSPFSLQANLSATPETFSEMYKVINKNLDTYKKTAKSTDFVSRLLVMKPLLCLKDDGNPPLLNLRIQFRVNREYEQNANRIIDWSLKVGAKNLSSSDKNKSVTWKYGDPVKLVLRWAANAPTFPVKEDNNPNLKIFGKTAIYEFTDSWSLLTMIQKHSQMNSAKTEYGDVLKFTLNTKENASSSETDKTIAFISLEVFENSDQKVKIPVLPGKAPEAE